MGNQSGCDLHMMQIINDNTCPYCRIAELERDLAEASEAIKLKKHSKRVLQKHCELLAENTALREKVSMLKTALRKEGVKPRTCRTCGHRHRSTCYLTGYSCSVERGLARRCGEDFERWVPREGVVTRLRKWFVGQKA